MRLVCSASAREQRGNGVAGLFVLVDAAAVKKEPLIRGLWRRGIVHDLGAFIDVERREVADGVADGGVVGRLREGNIRAGDGGSDEEEPPALRRDAVVGGAEDHVVHAEAGRLEAEGEPSGSAEQVGGGESGVSWRRLLGSRLGGELHFLRVTAHTTAFQPASPPC